MISFLFKIWGLARPYRWRLWLGVLTGVIAGLFEPLMIATITFVYAVWFFRRASMTPLPSPMSNRQSMCLTLFSIVSTKHNRRSPPV